MIKDDLNIDKRIYQVCRDAENEYSQSQKNNKYQNIENGLSSTTNYPMSNINYNSDSNNEFNENNFRGLNESYSKIAKINNKSIDTDANVLSKIKFGMKNEKKEKENTLFYKYFLKIIAISNLLLINNQIIIQRKLLYII